MERHDDEGMLSELALYWHDKHSFHTLLLLVKNARSN
jgi:hypothetical protein